LPAGRLPLLIVSFAAATLIDPLIDLLWAGELLSFTVSVKFDVPLAVGVPEIAPLDDTVRPAGRLPDVTAQL
jgi:hypothetical protein